jgi:hypothetical protein
MTTKISLNNLQSSVATAISSGGGGVKITGITYPNSATAGNTAGAEIITVTGSGFNSGATVYVDSNICNTTYVSSSSLTFVSPSKNIGSYHIFVYNTDGSSGVKPNGIIFSTAPSWVTSSGALAAGSLNNAYSQNVSATGDGTIAYSVTSGSLPTGLSLNSSTGAITGTPTVEATSNFTITATDSENQTTSRSFSIQSTGPVMIDLLLVAGGGPGGATAYGNGGAGGGGAGGLLYYGDETPKTPNGSARSAVPGTTYTVTIGAGGNGTVAGGTNTKGTNTTFIGGALSFTAFAGGRGGGYDGSGGDLSGGSGGGEYTGTTGSVVGQGNNGGVGPTGTPYTGGGGGGAGAAGAQGNTPSTGNGGIGLAYSITGSSTYYAGGGGGDGRGTKGTGGLGGGGEGSYANGYGHGVSGSTNTGGGGGGLSDIANGGSRGGNGGSGVVILRYADTSAAAYSTTGSPTITVAGGYRVYKFTSSGSITF